MFENNLNIIRRRWPEIAKELETIDKPEIRLEVKENTLIINNIQLTSNVNREKESQVQATLIPVESNIAYIFGTGLGDCQNALLKRENIETLNVIILNPEVFWCALNVCDHTGWLEDTRVNLYTPEKCSDVAFPFLALPAEMILCDDRSAQLRDRLEVELNHQFMSKQHKADSEFTQAISTNLSRLKKDNSITDLMLKNLSEVIVCGAGPTLADHIEWLREQRPFVIAVDAAVNALITNDIVPDIVVSIDPTSDKLFDDKTYNKLKNTALVYFPNSDPTLLDKWQGARYASYSDTPMYAAIKSELTHKPLFCAGSVFHPAIDLAIALSAKKVVMLGADFSYVYGQSHAKGTEDSYQQSADLATQWVLNSHGKRVPTMANLKAYLRDLERYISKQPDVEFFNGSAEGAKIEGAKLWVN